MDRATVQVSDALAIAHREIELILEFRDSMIAATVTGRLDVRRAEVAVIEGRDLLSELPSDDEDMEDELEEVD